MQPTEKYISPEIEDDIETILLNGDFKDQTTEKNQFRTQIQFFPLMLKGYLYTLDMHFYTTETK